MRRTLKFFKGSLDRYSGEIESFGNHPTRYAGLTDADGNLQIYDGLLRFKDPEGKPLATVKRPVEYAKYIAEATMAGSYLKSPYFRPAGYPDGIYRVGPMARLNVAEQCGTPEADSELEEYRQRFGRIAQSAFLNHYARLIEALYAVERMEQLLDDPAILSTHVRATAGVNSLEGVGIAEAPRGTLIHHYKVDEKGAIRWANLIIATGHNNLAIGQSLKQVAERYVDPDHLDEGMLNRLQAVVRAFDPCLSCSTHALGVPALDVRLLSHRGDLIDQTSW